MLLSLRIALTVSVVALLGCVGAQPVLSPPAGDDVTIFLHGYKGSFLQTSEGQLAWLSVGSVFSAGGPSLALPFEGQRDFARFDELHVLGPFTKVTALPGLIEEDGYGSFLEWARQALPGLQVFAYDWRNDVRSNGAALCERIAAMDSKRRVRIVAHSMGGLVSLACLRTAKPEVLAKVKKVVFLATPFRGAPGIWDDLHLGSATGANRSLLSAEALLTFPSAFQLLAPGGDFFVDAKGAPVSVPGAYDAQAWRDRRWGLFSDALPEAYVAELSKRFAENRALAELVAHDGPLTPYESMAVIGHAKPTVVGWPVAGEGFDFQHPITGDGDGVVPADRAYPPKYLHAAVVEVRGEHSELLRSKELQGVVAQFLR